MKIVSADRSVTDFLTTRIYFVRTCQHTADFGDVKVSARQNYIVKLSLFGGSSSNVETFQHIKLYRCTVRRLQISPNSITDYIHD